jgi:hypothetical protein
LLAVHVLICLLGSGEAAEFDDVDLDSGWDDDNDEEEKPLPTPVIPERELTEVEKLHELHDTLDSAPVCDLLLEAEQIREEELMDAVQNVVDDLVDVVDLASEVDIARANLGITQNK